MKKRIGILEGKPIITGDKNLKTSNEIHISDLRGDASSNGGEQPMFIGFQIYKPSTLGDGEAFRLACLTLEGVDFKSIVEQYKHLPYNNFNIDNKNYVTWQGSRIYKEYEDMGRFFEYYNPVMITDIVESRTYYIKSTNGVG